MQQHLPAIIPMKLYESFFTLPRRDQTADWLMVWANPTRNIASLLTRRPDVQPVRPAAFTPEMAGPHRVIAYRCSNGHTFLRPRKPKSAAQFGSLWLQGKTLPLTQIHAFAIMSRISGESAETKTSTTGVVFDSAGNLYGTAYHGGTSGGSVCQPFGCGVVWEITR